MIGAWSPGALEAQTDRALAEHRLVLIMRERVVISGRGW